MKQECYYQVNLANQEERIYRVVDVNVQRLVTEFDMFGNKLDVTGDIEPDLVPYFFK